MKTFNQNLYLNAFFLIVFITMFFSSKAQDYAAFEDYRQRFFVFKAGQLTAVETLKVQDFKVTKNDVIYLNNQGDIMLYSSEGKEKIDYNADSFKANDNLKAYSSGSVVKAIVGSKKEILTYNKGNYWMGDDIIFFEDSFQGTLNVFEGGKKRELVRGIFSSNSSDVTIGENLGVFKFSGGQYKLYWKGKTYDVITYTSNLTFQCGRDMMAFNDPITNSFVVFYQGQFYDVETQPAKSYSVGDNLLAYIDASGNFKVFDPSVDDLPMTIANYGTTSFKIKDNSIAFYENGWLKYYSEGETKEIVNYQPPSYAIDEHNLVYIDQNGMLKAIMDGEEKTITTEKISSFSLYNNCIVIQWVNNTSSVYWKGKMYDSY